MKLGVLRETKNPPDRRVALPPKQVIKLKKLYPNIDIVVQPSDLRAYKNEEYINSGIKMQEDLSDCDVLIGVKEVEIETLIEGKKYIFFSHTAKKQEYNKGLLQTVIDKKIQLIDYEYLTNIHGQRLVAFGRWAGIVGAYNSLYAYGKRTKLFDLKRAHECHDMDEFFGELMKISLPSSLKILISGGGRVAHGAMETLAPLAIRKISPQKFLKQEFDYPVYAQVDPWHYTKRKDGGHWDLENFFKHPNDYESTFKPYTKSADLYIACHFWDPKAPRFFDVKDMTEEDYRMKVIGDVSCDIDGPIPSTLKASTISEPIYGFNPFTGKEDDAYKAGNTTVMAVDNLPGEAPRNASVDFGNDLIDNILPPLLGDDVDKIIERASITVNGNLGKHFSYLDDWLKA